MCVKDAKDATRILFQGLKQRSQDGSRYKSHAVLSFDVKLHGGDNAAKLKILDLALHDNAIKIRSRHEMGSINQGIATFERVLEAVEAKKKIFIPYRDKKITWSIKDTLTKPGTLATLNFG